MNNSQHAEQLSQKAPKQALSSCRIQWLCSFLSKSRLGRTVQGGQNISLTIYSMSQRNPPRQKEQPLTSCEGGRTKTVNKACSQTEHSHTALGQPGSFIQNNQPTASSGQIQEQHRNPITALRALVTDTKEIFLTQKLDLNCKRNSFKFEAALNPTRIKPGSFLIKANDLLSLTAKLGFYIFTAYSLQHSQKSLKKERNRPKVEFEFPKKVAKRQACSNTHYEQKTAPLKQVFCREQKVLLQLSDGCHMGLVSELLSPISSHTHAGISHLHLQSWRHLCKKSFNSAFLLPFLSTFSPAAQCHLPFHSMETLNCSTFRASFHCRNLVKTREKFKFNYWYNMELKSWYRIKIPCCWLNLITWGKCVSIKSFTAKSQDWKYFQLLILCL